MKVRISFTLDVDDEAWAVEYGIDKSEVRKDVQTYVEYGVQADLDSRDLLIDR
jgi:hypothetical protein